MANVARVIERLESWRILFPFVMPEIARDAAQADDQVIVTQHVAIADDALPGKIDVLHLLQQDLKVRLLAKNGSNRLGDIRRRKSRSRHLVQQRLKQVMIRPVHDSDVCSWMRELLAKLQTAKSRAQHQRLRQLFVTHPPTLPRTVGTVKVGSSAQ